MSFRYAQDERKYKNGERNDLLDEPTIKAYQHWSIKPNRYPHTRISSKNDLLVLNRKCASLQELTRFEASELFKLLGELHDRYDVSLFNLEGMSSIKDVPHFHLYKLKAPYLNTKPV